MTGANDETVFRTLALYGGGGRLKASEFFSGAGGKFFELIGAPIDAVQLIGRDLPKVPISVDETQKVLAKQSARMEAISVFQSRENPQSYLFGWLAQAMVDSVSGLTIFSCRKDLFPSNYRDLLIQGSSVAPFYYGIIYDLPFNRGPAIFASGGLTEAWPGSNPAELAEQKRVSEWLYELPRAEQGDLRDVFPINLLTELHANRRNGACVLDTIREEGLGGILEIYPGIYEWRPKDLVRARNELIKHDLIICK